jgi:hypothetical protein
MAGDSIDLYLIAIARSSEALNSVEVMMARYAIPAFTQANSQPVNLEANEVISTSFPMTFTSSEATEDL